MSENHENSPQPVQPENNDPAQKLLGNLANVMESASGTEADRIRIKTRLNKDIAETLVCVREDRKMHPQNYPDVPDIEDEQWAFLDSDTEQEIAARIDGRTTERELDVLNAKILGRIEQFAGQTEQDEAAMKEIDGRFKMQSEKSGEKGDYERAFSNADVMEFLNGHPVKITEKIIRLRNGELTDTLDWEAFKRGEYASDARYLIRAMLGKMVFATGSRDEQVGVMGILKNLRCYGNDLYEGADDSTLQADVQYCILNSSKNVIYSCGAYKPKGLEGSGYVRGDVEKYADKTSKEVQKILFGGKGISKEWDDSADPPGFKGKVGRYDELNETGRGMIDIMVEWINSIKANKGMAAVEALEGKEFGKLNNAIKVYIAVKNSQGTEKEAGLKMLKIKEEDIPAIDESMGTMFSEYNTENTSHILRKGSTQGTELAYLLAKASGRILEIPEKWVPRQKYRRAKKDESADKDGNFLDDSGNKQPVGYRQEWFAAKMDWVFINSKFENTKKGISMLIEMAERAGYSLDGAGNKPQMDRRIINLENARRRAATPAEPEIPLKN